MSIIPFEFESSKFVGDWNYVAINTTCKLCNTSLYKPSPDKKEVNYVNCSISMGECKHAFHRKCMKKYNNRNIYCPLFNTMPYNNGPCNNGYFNYSKELETKGTIKLFKH
jgi:hypothetical protein